MVNSSDIKKLLDQQRNEWSLAKNNFDALSTVKSKIFEFDGFSIKVQFNPARILSTAAKVDPKSIQERKCFLCSQNLPEEQQGLPYGKKYTMLVNPFPIFPEHFTIPTNKHEDQLILDKYTDMLDLAKSLEDYTLFYNGPKCGASAPDHAHFQAGNKGFLPIEEDIETIQTDLLIDKVQLKVYALKNYLRNSILIESKKRDQVVDFFTFLYKQLEIKSGEQEPMLNLITWYKNNTWYSCIIPRENHRPSCFFAEDESQKLLISPASVDMGGVLITPQEKDFNKITAEDIKTLLEEVCLPTDKFESLCNDIKQYHK